MITIYEIAKIAHCSPSTVSKALNNSPEISQEKKKEIVSIAEKYRYIPNLSAQALSTKSNKLVGIIYLEDQGMGLSHYFYSDVIDSFRKTTEKLGYDIIFINSNEKMNYIDHCHYRGVEGVFIPIYDGHIKNEIHELLKSSIHVVMADMCEEEVTTIISDDVQGAEIACKHLLSLGHENIAHLAGPVEGEMTSISAQRRLQGYQNSINNPQIFIARDYSYEEGHRVMRTILSNKDIPTAIFAASDVLALGAMQAIQDHGLSIPKDISIIGYDDINILHFFRPMLTTIQQNKQLIGEQAANTLIARIHPNADTTTTSNTSSEISMSPSVLPVSLIERETCAPL